MSLVPEAVLNLIPDCIPDGDSDLPVDLVSPLQLGVAHAMDALVRPPGMVRLEHSSSGLHWDSAAESTVVYTNAPWITAVLVVRET